MFAPCHMVHVLMFLCHGKITLIFIVHLLWARLHSYGIRKMSKWAYQKQTLYCTSRKWKDETRSCCSWVGTKDWSTHSPRSSWRNTFEVILNFRIWSRHSKRWSLKKMPKRGFKWVAQYDVYSKRQSE